MVGLEVLEGLRMAEYLQEGSKSASRQRGEVWKLPLRPPRRTREHLSGHTWWSSHLQTCVCPYQTFLGRKKKKLENKSEPYCKELYSVSTKSLSCCCTCTMQLLPPPLFLLSSWTSCDQSSSPRARTHNSVISVSSST